MKGGYAFHILIRVRVIVITASRSVVEWIELWKSSERKTNSGKYVCKCINSKYYYKYIQHFAETSFQGRTKVIKATIIKTKEEQ